MLVKPPEETIKGCTVGLRKMEPETRTSDSVSPFSNHPLCLYKMHTLLHHSDVFPAQIARQCIGIDSHSFNKSSLNRRGCRFLVVVTDDNETDLVLG